MRQAHPFLSEVFLTAERATLEPLYLARTETTVVEREEVVGFVSVLEGTEIAALFVAQGVQRRGHGRRLLDAVRPAGRMSVEVMERNLTGRAFYHRYGFREIARRPHLETGMTLLRLVLG